MAWGMRQKLVTAEAPSTPPTQTKENLEASMKIEPLAVEARCSCSRERLHGVFATFSDEKRRDLVENGIIQVTCAYCSARYDFSPDDWETAGP